MECYTLNINSTLVLCTLLARISTSVRHDYYPVSTPVHNIISSLIHSPRTQTHLGKHCFECTIIQILRQQGALQRHYRLYREWSVRKSNPDYRLTMKPLSDCQCLYALRGQALSCDKRFQAPTRPNHLSGSKGLEICGRVSAFPPPHLSGGFPRHFRLREDLEGPGTPRVRSPATVPGPQTQAGLPAYR